MKTYSLAVLSVVVSYTMFAQGSFPMQVGNIWQYQSTNPFEPTWMESTIIGDTLLPNAKQYFIFTGCTFGTNFIRQESSKVYAYDEIDSAEYLLLDFTADEHDTLSRHSDGHRTVVAGGKQTDPLAASPYWKFYEYHSEEAISYIFFNWTVEENIGLTALTVEPGISFYLSGALVNGELIGTISGISGETNSIPVKPVLKQNYPNPFNPTTTIGFILSQHGYASIRIFNSLGQQVALLVDGVLPSGEQSVRWDASGYPSGAYFCRLQAGNFSETKKLLLFK